MAKLRRLPSKSFEINAAWTAETPVQGWRHYRISGNKPAKKAENLPQRLEMMAVCDRAVRFWLSRDELINDLNWIPGWKD
ncbi:MAG: TIGR02450 family Trp-rich protein [Proteobacteria bacterium]|nr:TIGR02450 family Trp-rich protein [Pseudomonadota bacterium]